MKYLFLLFLILLSSLILFIFRPAISARLQPGNFAELAFILIKENKVPPPPVKFAKGNCFAHAGGAVNGLTYTNSLDALNENYNKGARIFELDFEWTVDNQLVSIHDWNGTKTRIFGLSPGPMTHKDFIGKKIFDSLTTLDLNKISEWLVKHQDAYIVTDIKTDNIKALLLIKNNYPVVFKKTIPQIYRLNEYFPAKKAGYNNLILTLYVRNYNDYILKLFTDRYPVDIITMPESRAINSDLPEYFSNKNTYLFAHTINDPLKAAILYKKGFNGIYSDTLCKTE